MKWITLCLALAGLSTAAHAALQPAMSMIPDGARTEYMQLAQMQCPPPYVRNAAGQCICPPSRICRPLTICALPKVIDPKTGACICPAGTVLTANGGCVRCPPPRTIDARTGACVCPPGTHLSPVAANLCVPDNCPPPRVMNAAGQCVCPPGTHQAAAANICIPDCPPGQTVGPNGQCACPSGMHPNPNGVCVTN